MIVYSSTLAGFMDDVMTNDIEHIVAGVYTDVTGHRTSQSQLMAFRNSLQFMDRVLSGSDVPKDAGVAIEYTIPQSSKRVDFILTGRDEKDQDTAIIIELKQWESARLTDKDAVVSTRFMRGESETAHPSYQAWSYKSLLEDYNQTVQEENIQLVPCAYLHNYEDDDVIRNSFYQEYIDRAPVFLKQDALKLRKFLNDYIRHSDKNNILYRIDHGKIKPSKNLADKLDSMLKGNQEFVLIDEQKVAYETALKLATGEKKVLIIEGGPGTGKSVLAVNLLVEFTKRELVAQYVTRNAAPREVYEAKLSGSMKKSNISNLLKGSGSFISTEENTFDCLIVDEAHRLTEKSGMFSHLGVNQIKEIIAASKLSIFFIDELQQVTLKDIGSKQEIVYWADQQGADVTHVMLDSQFRCNGSDGYLAALENALQLLENKYNEPPEIEYDFRVFDSPQEVHNLIKKKNVPNNKARLVAGYCWKWISSKDPTLKDIVIGDYEATWNLKSDGQSWIIKKNSVEEVGCIHTSQGLEVDYIGVIIGPDLIVRDGKIITDVTKRASSDKSVYGWKKMMKENPDLMEVKLDALIKNTYRTLMTRGQKGCYIYCTDAETADYFKSIASTARESTNLLL